MSEIDPIIEQVRAIKESRAAKFNYDIDAMFDDLERHERESDREFIPYLAKQNDKDAEPAQAGKQAG